MSDCSHASTALNSGMQGSAIHLGIKNVGWELNRYRARAPALIPSPSAWYGHATSTACESYRPGHVVVKPQCLALVSPDESVFPSVFEAYDVVNTEPFA